MLTRLNQWAKECPDKRAVVTDQQTLTYYELWQAIITDKKLPLEERPQVIHEQPQAVDCLFTRVTAK